MLFLLNPSSNLQLIVSVSLTHHPFVPLQKSNSSSRISSPSLLLLLLIRSFPFKIHSLRTLSCVTLTFSLLQQRCDPQTLFQSKSSCLSRTSCIHLPCSPPKLSRGVFRINTTRHIKDRASATATSAPHPPTQTQELEEHESDKLDTHFGLLGPSSIKCSYIK